MPPLDRLRVSSSALAHAWLTAHQRSSAEWIRRMEAKPRDAHLSR